MKRRQETQNINDNTTPTTLIWPVLYREIDPMPPIVSNIKYLDYSRFNVVGEAFFKTEKYLDFQDQLQRDIKSIISIIKNVPPLNSEWYTPVGRAQIRTELNNYLAQYCILDEDQKQNPITW